MQQTHITNLNTTIIGDYIAAVYPEYQDKWLVQAIGNATFSSTLDAIVKDSLIINRKNIFLQLGGNQVRTSNKSSVHKQMLAVIIAIRKTNPEARIFVVGVLPWPIENQQVKTQVMMFNRWLHDVAEHIDKLFARVK